MINENIDNRVKEVLLTISLFKDKPVELKAMIKLHCEVIFLDGIISGTKATQERLT